MSSLRVTVELRRPAPGPLRVPTVTEAEANLDRDEAGVTREDVSRIIADLATAVARLTLPDDEETP